MNRRIIYLVYLPYIFGFVQVPCIKPKYLTCTSMTKNDFNLKNNTLNNIPKNTSIVYKISYQNPEEEMHEPRYMFGLSEYQMILLRIYVNIVVTIYFVMLYFENLSKY